MRFLRRKKVDPVSQRARALKVSISVLEEDTTQCPLPVPPRLRAAAWPAQRQDPGNVHSASVHAERPASGIIRPVSGANTVWSDTLLTGAAQPRPGETPVAHPKLISYLAAGSVQGLMPMRCDRRITRNRLLALVLMAAALLWGIISALVLR